MLTEATKIYTFLEGQIVQTGKLIVNDNFNDQVNMQQNGFINKTGHIPGVFLDSWINLYSHKDELSEKFLAIINHHDSQYYTLVTGIFTLNQFFKSLEPMYRLTKQSL